MESLQLPYPTPKNVKEGFGDLGRLLFSTWHTAHVPYAAW